MTSSYIYIIYRPELRSTPNILKEIFSRNIIQSFIISRGLY